MKKSFLITVCACFLIFTLLRYPEAMLDAGGKSVTLWFNRVLPSLFPFMIACGLLLKMGAAEKMGKILSPLMEPLFALPGIAAFPFFLGIFSGYPLGAKMTATLYEEKKITLPEAEHILSFSNNPGPLFLVGTVATAFFHAPFWGYVFLLCCFLGALLTGLLFRFQKPKTCRSSSSVLRSAPVPPLSQALSHTISDSIDTIAQIGGYMLLFAVLSEGLVQIGFFRGMEQVLSFLPFSDAYLLGMGSGVLEMTNGAYFLSQAQDPLLYRLAGACSLVAFGGLSILCQTFGVLQAVPIKKSRYMAAKLCNSLFSGMFFLLLYPYLEKYAQKGAPVFSAFTETAFSSSFSWGIPLVLLAIAILPSFCQK